jgi:N-formylglutamate amidohydrolase
MTWRLVDLLSGDQVEQEPSSLYSVSRTDAPLVYTVPHAGLLVPVDLVDTWNLGEAAVQDTDLHTDRLYDLPGTRVITSLNRYAVNMNRPRWREKGVSEYDEEDALRTYLKGMRPSWAKPIQNDWKQALLGVYDAYHAAVRALLQERIDEYGYVFLVTAHSMNAEADDNTPDSGRRPDVTICTEYGRGTDPSVIEAMQTGFPDGFDVAVDDPYAGGFTTEAYAAGSDVVHGVQIEVSKACYMDEDSYAYEADQAAVVQDALRDAVSRGLDEVRRLEDGDQD